MQPVWLGEGFQTTKAHMAIAHLAKAPVCSRAQDGCMLHSAGLREGFAGLHLHGHDMLHTPGPLTDYLRAVWQHILWKCIGRIPSSTAPRMSASRLAQPVDAAPRHQKAFWMLKGAVVQGIQAKCD